LHHSSRSVGWNCSNIAAYPTVPVVSISLLSDRAWEHYIGKRMIVAVEASHGFLEDEATVVHDTAAGPPRVASLASIF
jgi:hypothetical protein